MKRIAFCLMCLALSAQTPRPPDAFERLHTVANQFATDWNIWAHLQNDNLTSIADKQRVRTLRKDFAKVDRAFKDAGYD